MHCYSASSVASVFRSSGYKHTNVTGNHDCGCTSPNWSRFVCVYAKGKENVKFSVWFVLSNTKRIDWGGGSLPPRNLGLGTRWRSDRSASRPNCFILGGRAVWGIRNDENAVKYREWSQLLSSHWTDRAIQIPVLHSLLVEVRFTENQSTQFFCATVLALNWHRFCNHSSFALKRS